MARRRKPKMPYQPLLIIDDCDRPDNWLPVNQLPPNTNYGWSEKMVVCQMTPGDFRPTVLLASYDFRRSEWRTSVGTIENITHWQPLPDYPREYRL